MRCLTRISSGFRPRPSLRDELPAGHEGVRQWIDDMKRDWEAFEPRPEDFRDLGDDRVLALGSWHARGRGGNVPLDFPQAAWLARYREGRLVRMQTFTERDEALEAAGLSGSRRCRRRT